MATTAPSTIEHTASILQEYIAALAALDADPRVSLDPVEHTRRKQALAHGCLSQLNQARTSGIVGLLEQTVRVLKADENAHDSRMSAESLRSTLTSSSQPLAELLRMQLVSESEEGLYGVCRVAWDHVHVGKRVVELMEEVERLEWEDAFGGRVAGVERGLAGMMRVDIGREEEGADQAFVGLLERDVVGNLRGLVDMRDEVGKRGGEQGRHERCAGTVAALVQQTQKSMVELIARSVLFEKGGLPKPRCGVRLRALLGAAMALDGLVDVEGVQGIVEQISERVSDMVFTHSIRKVLVTFGDRMKHPVGYREKVVLKVLVCLKEEVLFGDEFWAKTVGRVLWQTVVGWYTEEWEKRARSGDDENDGDESVTMKRITFAKKLEGKVAVLLGMGDGHASIAAASSRHIKGILNRRRAATICAVRDALFGFDIADCSDETYRVIEQGDTLITWNIGDLPENEPMHGNSSQQQPPTLLAPDVMGELRSLYGDAPLGHADSRLLVLESHASAVERLAKALQENGRLLTDGQYSHFMGTLAEDVSSLLVALVELRGDHEDAMDSAAALKRASLEYMSCVYVARSICLMRFGDGHGDAKHISTALPALDGACQRIIQLAENQILGRRLDVFRQEYLVEHLEALTSWRQHVDIQAIIAKKKSASRLLYAFGQLSKALETVPDTFVIVITTELLDWVADLIVDSILDLRDISEELSEAFAQILEGFSEDIMDAVGPRVSSPCSLQRLKQLCRVMGMTSAEIVEAWQDGVLGQLFDREEIVSLIKALFEMTDQVRHNLNKLGA